MMMGTMILECLYLVGRSGSKIQIFDRYGKLLKEISPNSTGWNGTYNGQPLPATDYWFVVDYPEDGIKKIQSTLFIRDAKLIGGAFVYYNKFWFYIFTGFRL
jgi:gliding motility-associated-like protein